MNAAPQVWRNQANQGCCTHVWAGGPNSPLPWAELAVGVLLGDPPRPELARKLLLGLPWYGYDNTQAILGNDYVALLRKVRPKVLQWNAEAQEHYFEYTQSAFPCCVLMSCCPFVVLYTWSLTLSLLLVTTCVGLLVCAPCIHRWRAAYGVLPKPAVHPEAPRACRQAGHWHQYLGDRPRARLLARLGVT